MRFPEYHDDHLRGVVQVLSYGDNAGDMLACLRRARFASAEVVNLPTRQWWGNARPVIVARKSERLE